MEFKRSAILPIIGINVVFFLMQTFVAGFEGRLILVGSDVFLRPWILLTSMFLHGGFYHIFVNMYMLLIFGSILEQRIGTKRFLQVYFASGIVAGFIASFFYESALGASGAIMGIMGALVLLIPNMQLLFFFIIPVPMWLAGIIYLLMDTLGVLFPSGVGNIAHIAGMAVGFIYAMKLKGKAEKFSKEFSSKKHLEDADIEEYLKSGRV